MKKKLFLKFFIFTVIGALATMTSCKDYDEDIENLQTQINGLKTTVDAINASLENGEYITKVEKIVGGIKVTLSDGTVEEIKNGSNGAPGSVVEIGENGNWFIDGKDTGNPSKGDKGDKGDAGNGAGIDDFFVPNADGFWHKFVDGKDTGSTGEKWLPAGILTAVWDKETGTVTLNNVEGFDGPVTLTGAPVLTSLVHFPEYYIGGVETVFFRPLILGTNQIITVDPTDPNGCPVDPQIPVVTCMENVGSLVTFGNKQVRMILPNSSVKYHVSPSALNLDMIDKDNMTVTSHLAAFRAGGVEDKNDNPFSASFVELSNKGILTVDLGVDPVKFFNAYKFTDLIPQAGQETKAPILALQVPHSKAALDKLPAGSNTYVTSDYTMATVIPVTNIDIAKNTAFQDTPELYANYLGNPATGSSDIAGFPAGADNAKAQLDGVNNGSPADLRIVRLVEGQTLNLLDHVLGVAQSLIDSTQYEVLNIDEYGFNWHFDLLDGNDKPIKFELTNNKTDQQEFINLTDKSKGTISARVYTQDPAGAAVDRTPIVRVRIMSGDCTVSEAFVKVLIVKEGEVGPKPIDLGTYTAATPAGCDAAFHQMNTQEVNEKIYNFLGMSKEKFVEVYGPAAGYVQGTEPANVVVNEMGRFEWVYDEETGRSTYLPKWTVEACEYFWCPGETEKLITSIVTITPIENGYSTLSLTYNALLKKPEINLTKVDFNVGYWNSDFTKVQHHTTKPILGNADPANCIYSTNLNAAFKTHANELLKLGEEFVTYEYLFAPAAEQIKKDIDGKTNITVRISTDGKELYAKLAKNVVIDGVTIYTAGTEELIATIEDHTATNITDPVGADMLTYNEGSELAKYLLNSSKNFMWAKLQIKAECTCAPLLTVPVKINGNDGFTVEFLRPINVNTTTSEKYIDGIDFGKKGSYLNIYNLAGLVDWRGDKFKDNANYAGFYGVEAIELAKESVQWDANGQVEAIPSTLKVEYFATQADVNAAYPGFPTLSANEFGQYGIVTYNNNQTVTKSFNLYIPIKVTYKWGIVVSETVKVQVEGTTVTR